MTTAPAVHRRTSVPTAHRLDASNVVALPNALDAALREFGLMPVFRTRPPALQIEYARRVAEAGEGEQPDRIADILDELATYSFLTFPERNS